jgi:hypothetical protein
MITMPAQIQTSAKMVSAWEWNIVAKNHIRNPVVFKVLNAMAMEHASLP